MVFFSSPPSSVALFFVSTCNERDLIIKPIIVRNCTLQSKNTWICSEVIIIFFNWMNLVACCLTQSGLEPLYRHFFFVRLLTTAYPLRSTYARLKQIVDTTLRKPSNKRVGNRNIFKYGGQCRRALNAKLVTRSALSYRDTTKGIPFWVQLWFSWLQKC